MGRAFAVHTFAGYLGGSRIGAIVYNAAHSYMMPMTLMTIGFVMAQPLVLSLAIIWLAHIGFDRALGYGLKYAAGFGFTHLGRIGNQSSDAFAGSRAEAISAAAH